MQHLVSATVTCPIEESEVGEKVAFIPDGKLSIEKVTTSVKFGALA